MELLQGGRQLDAVADGDVADQAAFADHHPGELVEGVRPSPADHRPGLDLDAAEPAGVDGRPGLGQHQRLALPQQPPIAGPEHLPGHQQDQPGAQLVAMMTPGRDMILQRQIGPAESGGIRSAGQPLLLPGVADPMKSPVRSRAIGFEAVQVAAEHWYRHRTSIENIFRDSKLGAALRHLPSGYHQVNMAWM